MMQYASAYDQVEASPKRTYLAKAHLQQFKIVQPMFLLQVGFVTQ